MWKDKRHQQHRFGKRYAFGVLPLPAFQMRRFILYDWKGISLKKGHNLRLSGQFSQLLHILSSIYNSVNLDLNYTSSKWCSKSFVKLSQSQCRWMTVKRRPDQWLEHCKTSLMQWFLLPEPKSVSDYSRWVKDRRCTEELLCIYTALFNLSVVSPSISPPNCFLILRSPGERQQMGLFLCE